VSAGEVLPVKLGSPPYTAVIWKVLTARGDVVKLACPPLNVSVARVAAAFFKITVPVGVPENCGDTVTVKVTCCPGAEGFSEETTVGVVVAVVPEPDRTMVCELPLALSVMVIVALSAVGVEAVKMTLMLQPIAGRNNAGSVPHVLVTAKSAAFGPADEMADTLSDALPVLLRLTVCAALASPTGCEPNDSVLFESVATGVCVSTEIALDAKSGTAKSSRPSLLKSPAVGDPGFSPVA
jgi:hypothetical protein